MQSTRLTPDRWLKAGLAALQNQGPQALAAEPLARAMGTTKGSFYWHFSDLPAFHNAVIETWRSDALSSLGQAVSGEEPADQRLRQFGQTVLADKSEMPLRIWAQTNTFVAETLAIIDAERLTYLSLLLRELGLGNADFALALQATLIGLPQMHATNIKDQQRTYDALVDTVLALRG